MKSDKKEQEELKEFIFSCLKNAQPCEFDLLLNSYCKFRLIGVLTRNIGCSTISLIMSRFNSCGKNFDTLKQMPADEVEQLFFPPENLRRKADAVMPDYPMVYERLTAPGSKANLFYLWLKYKKERPSGYPLLQEQSMHWNPMGQFPNILYLTT